jgi:predicted metal-dependent hydrolase
MKNNKASAQLAILGEYEVVLDKQTVPYTLKRSTKARLIWLKINRQTGLTVTIPYNYPVNKLPEYLESNQRWILRNSAKFSNPADDPQPVSLQNKGTIRYLGDFLEIRQERNTQGPPTIKIEQNKLIVSLSPSYSGRPATELEQWLKTQATVVINDKARLFSFRMGLMYKRITIRNQKSRWGSCSGWKNLNFNWRLIMAPEAVLDYVIIHELCHLQEMSHSRAFWKLVALYCPQWQEYRHWLNKHTGELNAGIQI